MDLLFGWGKGSVQFSFRLCYIMFANANILHLSFHKKHGTS